MLTFTQEIWVNCGESHDDFIDTNESFGSASVFVPVDTHRQPEAQEGEQIHQITLRPLSAVGLAR